MKSDQIQKHAAAAGRSRSPKHRRQSRRAGITASHHSLLKLPLRRGAGPHSNAAAAAARRNEVVAHPEEGEEGVPLFALPAAEGWAPWQHWLTGRTVRACCGQRATDWPQTGCHQGREHSAAHTDLQHSAATATHLPCRRVLSGKDVFQPPMRRFRVSMLKARICGPAM